MTCAKILNLLKKALICQILIIPIMPAFALPILVVGHKNPDSDAIFSAISLAHLKSQQGQPAIAIALGQPNPETQFGLDFFKLTAILSDTLAFRSPTSTESDQIAAKSLASIAGVKDLLQYAQQMHST
jgi:inorganic pyrophosphatase/exopolyphosphatase